MDWLSPLSFAQKQLDIFSKRSEGSGRWFLGSKEYQAWLASNNSVLWCYGIPGSGKTFMSAIAFDHLSRLYAEDMAFGVAGLFCQYKAQDQQTATNLVACLWRALAEKHDKLLKEVEEAFQRHSRRQTRPAFGEVVSLLVSEMQRYRNVIFLIEGLDECSEENGVRADFIRAIQSIMTGVPKDGMSLQLMVTSRMAQSIFNGATEFEIRAADSDITGLITSRIDSGLCLSKTLSAKIREDQGLREQVVTRIIEKADGSFLRPQMLLKELETKTNLSNIRDALNHLLEGQNCLDELYHSAWSRITDQNSDRKELARRALCWLSHAYSQLTVEMLRHALAVKTGDTALDDDRLDEVDEIISSCQGLAVYDSQSRVIRLAHYTTQEYFNRNSARLFPDAHSDLAVACLAYLNFKEFAYGPTRGDSDVQVVVRRTEQEHQLLCSRLRHNPLLQYAASYWGSHARSSGEQPVLSYVLAFLQAPGSMASSIEAQCELSWHYNLLEATLLEDPAFHLAIFFRLQRTCTLLLEKKAFVTSKQQNNRKKPSGTMECSLHCAIDCGNTDILRLLLRSGVTFSSHNKLCGMLGLVILKGDFDAAKALLERNGAMVLHKLGINRELQGRSLFKQLKKKVKTFCNKDYLLQFENDKGLKRCSCIHAFSDALDEEEAWMEALRSTGDHVPSVKDEAFGKVHSDLKISKFFRMFESAPSEAEERQSEVSGTAR